MGALVLVSLIRKGETSSTSPAVIIGSHVSDAFKGGFIAISASLGALGSFFSGSTTVSNLTFGRVQAVRIPESVLTGTYGMVSVAATLRPQGAVIFLALAL
jgi:L-lactate permease